MTLVESQIYNRASESLETRRIPDPYIYSLNRDGKLILAYTGQIVENYIETSTYLGKTEFEGLVELQNWFNTNPSGKMIWISPPYTGEYKSPKIIVSEIVKELDSKILFNRAIVLDGMTPTDCFLYARDLSGIFPESVEGLRKKPIAIHENLDWLSLLSEYLNVSIIKEYIESGQDKLEKEEAIKAAKSYINAGHHQTHSELKFGNHALRCRGRTSTETAFQFLAKGSFLYDKYGTRQFECPTCHSTNTRPENVLIENCQHCGSNVSCKEANN